MEVASKVRAGQYTMDEALNKYGFTGIHKKALLSWGTPRCYNKKKIRTDYTVSSYGQMVNVKVVGNIKGKLEQQHKSNVQRLASKFNSKNK